ncbi:MAG: DNA repair protein RecO [Gammaproteobacteria bacterium]|nr:DNA repair protein RecO [Gammaproteobacteria bacterium]
MQVMDNAYVLHRRRYRESSLIVEFLTPAHGRLAAVARGAMRRKSDLAAVLQPLVPLVIETRGRGELQTLVRAESSAPARPLSGRALYAVFYLNELVMHLTVAGDPLPELFHAYERALSELGDGALEAPLRRFETVLLDVIGLGLHLDSEAGGARPLAASGDYVYVVDNGPEPYSPGRHGCRVAGATLLALATGGPFDPVAAREAKTLMRYVLNHHLDGRPLASRELFGGASGQA